MLEKPPYGSPCNSCGQCCQDELCPLARRVFGERHGPCPALSKLDVGFGCGLMLTPWRYAPEATAHHGAQAMREAAALLCAASLGCDAEAPGENVDEELRAKVLGPSRALPREAVEHARNLWSKEV